MAVASLVLGIVSIVFALIVPVAWIGIIAGVIGIVLGVVAKKQEPSGMATGGIVTSIIGTALAAVLYLSCVYCAHRVSQEIQKDPNFSKSMEQLRKFSEQQQQQNP